MCSNVPAVCKKCEAWARCNGDYVNEDGCEAAPGVCASCWGYTSCAESYTALPAATITASFYSNAQCTGTPLTTHTASEDVCVTMPQDIMDLFSITSARDVVYTSTGYSCSFESDCATLKDKPYGDASWPDGAGCNMHPVNVCKEYITTGVYLFLQVKYAVVETTHKVVTSFAMSGSASDFAEGTAALDSIRKVLAGELGVSITAVKVTVSEGSVVVRAEIFTDTAAAADAIGTTIASSATLSDTAALSSAINSQLATDGVALTVSVVSAPTQPETQAHTSENSGDGSGMTGAIAGGAGVIVLLAILIRWFKFMFNNPKREKTRPARPAASSTKGGALGTASTVSAARQGVPQPMASSAARPMMATAQPVTPNAQPVAPIAQQVAPIAQPMAMAVPQGTPLVAAPQMVQPIMHPPPSQPAWPSMQPAPTQPAAVAGFWGTRFDPKTGKQLPKFDPRTGKQNWGEADQQRASRFDPNTGKELPKFDPATGKQNWW